jgi:putative endonuclease
MTDQAAKRLGVRGEDLGVAELERRGMTILERNWRCRLGEIDIVAAEVIGRRTTVVFCEVKCRAGLGYGDPLEAITYAKVRKLRQLAAEWLAQPENWPDSTRPAAIRIDAIGVVLPRGQAPSVRYERGIG